MTCPAKHPRCQHTRDTDMRLYGCTCAEARRHRSRRMKEARLRRLRGQSLLTPAIGSVRRLQALHVLGWRQSDIADRLGWHQQAVAQILTDRTWVTLRTADAIKVVYDELWDSPGPSAITAKRAARKGWAPPLFWIDDEIDNPDVTPEYQPYQPMRGDELAAEALRLSVHGLSALEVAERLGVSDRTVVRARSRSTGAGGGEPSAPVHNLEDAA